MIPGTAYHLCARVLAQGVRGAGWPLPLGGRLGAAFALLQGRVLRLLTVHVVLRPCSRHGQDFCNGACTGTQECHGNMTLPDW